MIQEKVISDRNVSEIGKKVTWFELHKDWKRVWGGSVRKTVNATWLDAGDINLTELMTHLQVSIVVDLLFRWATIMEVHLTIRIIVKQQELTEVVFNRQTQLNDHHFDSIVLWETHLSYSRKLLILPALVVHQEKIVNSYRYLLTILLVVRQASRLEIRVKRGDRALVSNFNSIVNLLSETKKISLVTQVSMDLIPT